MASSVDNLYISQLMYMSISNLTPPHTLSSPHPHPHSHSTPHPTLPPSPPSHPHPTIIKFSDITSKVAMLPDKAVRLCD